jgi:hypothetical protein
VHHLKIRILLSLDQSLGSLSTVLSKQPSYSIIIRGLRIPSVRAEPTPGSCWTKCQASPGSKAATKPDQPEPPI